jgi:uncharacterized protein DUF6328
MPRANTVPVRTNGQHSDQASVVSSASRETSTSGESLKDKLDRELVELLQEMRIMLPGIEVIFGFLLTVPFTERFTRLTSLQTSTYFAVFISTALATAFLVAPSAYHRLRWRQYDKEHLLRVANKFAIAGLAFFAVSLTGIAFIVTDVVIRTTTAVWVAVGIGLIVTLLWFGLPIFRSAQDEDEAG